MTTHMVPGMTVWRENFEFGAFIDPSGQNQLYHIPLVSKICDLNDRKKLVNNPFKPGVVNLGLGVKSNQSGSQLILFPETIYTDQYL